MKLIGQSLSLCIKDIIAGRVHEDQVEEIVANTKAETEQDFKDVLDYYAKSYWTDNPAKGQVIALRLWASGKIEQPRLKGDFRAQRPGWQWTTLEGDKYSPQAKPPESDGVE